MKVRICGPFFVSVLVEAFEESTAYNLTPAMGQGGFVITCLVDELGICSVPFSWRGPVSPCWHSAIQEEHEEG